MNFDDEIDSPVCLNCGSTNLYRDGESDDLICNDCNTQSQSYSQRETAEDTEGTTTVMRRSGSVPIRPSRRSINIVEDEIDEDFKVPSLMEFTEAFLELVESAARKSVSDDLLPNLSHIEGFENYKEQIVKDSREIFFLFLERWDEAANDLMIKYPGVRVSLLDKFLPNFLRVVLWKQLNLSCVGKFDGKRDSDTDNDDKVPHKRIDKEDEEEDEDEEETEKQGSQSQSKSPKRVQWDNSQSTLLFDSQESTIHTPTSRMRNESQSNTDFKQFQKPEESHKASWKKLKTMIEYGGMKLKDETLHWKLAIVDIYPDMTLATSIVYLAHLCSQTGVASNLFIAWAKMGKYPHLLDAYGQLSDRHQEKLQNVKSRWRRNRRHLPDPDDLDRSVVSLLTCLVEPKDPKDNFLSDQYRLNVERMENSTYLKKTKLINLLREKKRELKVRKEGKDNSAESSLLQRENEDFDLEHSPLKAFHLGQSSQESEGSLYPDIPPTFFNVGIMSNLFCAHLGVDNRVLEFSHALMGLPVYCDSRGVNQEDWLPSPLKLAQPKFIVSPIHLIAVIVAAAKFVPGWEKWVIKLNVDNSNENEESNHGKLSQGKDDDSSSSQSEDEVLLSLRSTKRRRLGNGSETDGVQGSTPGNSTLGEFNFRDSNGDNAFDYLDFMPEESRASISAEFRGALSSLSSVASLKKRGTAVAGNVMLSGHFNNDNKEVKDLKSRMGLSAYFAHRNPVFQVTEAVYEPYAMLISYFSERLAVDKNTLHYLVFRLDDEIIQTAQPSSNIRTHASYQS